MIDRKINLSNYGNYSSDNYGSSRMVKLGSLKLYFSYKTIIAIKDNKTNKFIVSENKWNNTTGKHLNWIDRDKSIRLNREEFEKKAEKILKRYNLIN